ncbi:hypothetical protein, partial [Xanthomonas sp. LMG 8992]|uniref:hypothetical protein n=1 Tax=Xanthomonas sp. LMG 8992 TaxID=1591157 RepID=UPI001F31F9E2
MRRARHFAVDKRALHASFIASFVLCSCIIALQQSRFVSTLLCLFLCFMSRARQDARRQSLSVCPVLPPFR